MQPYKTVLYSDDTIYIFSKKAKDDLTKYSSSLKKRATDRITSNNLQLNIKKSIIWLSRRLTVGANFETLKSVYFLVFILALHRELFCGVIHYLR